MCCLQKTVAPGIDGTIPVYIKKADEPNRVILILSITNDTTNPEEPTISAKFEGCVHIETTGQFVEMFGFIEELFSPTSVHGYLLILSSKYGNCQTIYDKFTF